jgi:pyrimidine deaminase RibD-like protein
MKISDFQIHDHTKLDGVLLKLCELIIEGKKKDSAYYGMVGSCIVDPDNNEVYALNYYKDEDHRVHAERAAVEKYEAKYGKVPNGSICVTTLSPCSEQHSEMADERYGSSCTDFLNSSNIKKVYCGYKDPTQVNTDAYKHKRFHIEETRNKKLREACKMFADTFLKNTLP